MQNCLSPRKSSAFAVPVLMLCFVCPGCAKEPAASSGWETQPPIRRSPSDCFTNPDMIALAKSSASGNLDEIDRLVSSGVDLNARGKNGMTVLLWAMQAENKKAFKRLLEHGADPNIQLTNGKSVTSFTASVLEDSDWLEMVLKHGANGVSTFDNLQRLFGDVEISLGLRPAPVDETGGAA